MRRDRLYLNDIIEAADAISNFLAGVTKKYLSQKRAWRPLALAAGRNCPNRLGWH